METGPSAHRVKEPRAYMTAAFIIALLYLLGLVVLVAALRRAPEGFEDDEGFHAGQHELEEEELSL